MIHLHSSTAQQRAQWVNILVAQEGTYGVVSQLSKQAKVSRQTLYSWKAKGRSARPRRFQTERAGSAAIVGTSGLDVIGGRTRQLSRHSSLFGCAAGPARESGNDYSDRARGWSAGAKVVGTASL